MQRQNPKRTLALLTVPVWVMLAACTTQTASTTSTAAVSAEPAAGSDEREVASITPRVVVSHDGGLITLDAADGSIVGQTDHPGFLRLNDAGDGRHVLVSDSDVFRVYDAGIEAEAHGDHYHYRQATPTLTEVSYKAPQAGHVVVHHGFTTLFADGTGDIQTIESARIAEPDTPVQRASTAAPHHGVALQLTNGDLFATEGTEDTRDTVRIIRGGQVVAETTNCPGSHGEAAAAPNASGDVVVMGCENGPVVFRDGAFHKIPVDDAYARSGNLAGSENSPTVLGDYKVDEDADLERPTRVALIDSHAGSLRLVDLGSPYWFRSLARGPQGEGLVLTYDGAVNVIDTDSGEIAARIPAIAPWQEKDNWQLPGPAIEVAGSTAYVTDAENAQLAVVDLKTNTVTDTFDLPVTPVEIAVVTGEPEAPAQGHDHDEEHDH